MSNVYIHEFIDIVGHNRARYMHHMTANWCPVARAERGQLCLGVWATVGSTGRWPEVVNMWELDGWDGLVHNLEVELSGGRDQDPSLAAWWATAASLRRGGVDRIVVAEPGTRGVAQLIADGVRGELYAHELLTVPPGSSPELAGRHRRRSGTGLRRARLDACRHLSGRHGQRHRGDHPLGDPEPGRLGEVRAGGPGGRDRAGSVAEGGHRPRRRRGSGSSSSTRRCRRCGSAASPR